MKAKEINEFKDVATKYCNLIDAHNSFKEETGIQDLLVTLSELYTKALALPDADSKGEEPLELIVPEPVIEFGNLDAYAMIFNPFQDKKPVIGLLSDDLSDIYIDLKRGLMLYEQEALNEAVWEWKFYFEVHWGKHITSAIHALHSIKYDDL